MIPFVVPAAGPPTSWAPTESNRPVSSPAQRGNPYTSEKHRQRIVNMRNRSRACIHSQTPYAAHSGHGSVIGANCHRSIPVLSALRIPLRVCRRRTVDRSRSLSSSRGGLPSHGSDGRTALPTGMPTHRSPVVSHCAPFGIGHVVRWSGLSPMRWAFRCHSRAGRVTSTDGTLPPPNHRPNVVVCDVRHTVGGPLDVMRTHTRV